MSEDRKLDIEKISGLVTSSSDNFKEEVKDLDLTLDDLRALKKAEKSGKNREKIVQFIDKQITEENVSAYLGVAEEDLGELSDLITEIESVEDIEHFEEENIEIDQDQLIDLVGGTVKELKNFVNENPLDATQIKDVLEAEKKVKDRKTAKSFLERKIEKRKIGEDVEEAKEDLEKLKEDVENVKEDRGLETEELESSNETSEEEGEEDENNEEDKEKASEESNAENDAEEESEDSSKEDDKDNREEKENEDDDSEDEDDGKSEFEKKKELAEELELDMSDEELENFSLEDLEKIKEEKRHREDLIERLEEGGMDEEELRESSTEDLEKIAGSLEKDSESQEEHEEMREEAEEDLEMLMGAVRWDDEEGDEEDEGLSAKEKLNELKHNLRDKLNRGGKKEESSIDTNKVHEVLDQYRNLDSEEASIKTAHVMKGFLENNLGIEREMTYKELAENMPTENEDMEELSEFFLKLHREQYTGKLTVSDHEEIIDICGNVIEDLA